MYKYMNRNPCKKNPSKKNEIETHSPKKNSPMWALQAHTLTTRNPATFPRKFSQVTNSNPSALCKWTYMVSPAAFPPT